MTMKNDTSVILRAMTADGSARVSVINSTAIVNEAAKIHGCSATVEAALGRLLTAASLIGNLLPERNDSLTIGLNGGGPAGKFIAVSDYYGNVRGWVENPLADPPARPDGKLNVGAAVGCDGSLYMVRDIGGDEPQHGTVVLRSGEIAEDIAAFFAESEQIPTLCALGVMVDRDLTCIGAGGILIQLLPNADPDVLDILERNAAGLSKISDLFVNGATCEDIMKIALKGIEYNLFDETEVEYKCTCSRERFLNTIAGFGREEVLRLLDEAEGDGMGRELETKCRFCQTTNKFGESELLARVAELEVTKTESEE